MRLEKMHKEEKEIPATIKVIKKYLPILKEMHLELLGSTDSIPYVTWLDFGDFGFKCKFID
jgi:hypothetical protein